MATRVTLPSKELLARHAAGASVPTLAKEFGCSEPTVRAYLRRLGALAPPRPRRPITRTALEELYAQRGWPLARIAEHFGVRVNTVDQRRRDFGIPALRRPRSYVL